MNERLKKLIGEANEGSAHSQYTLGVEYLLGLSVEQDIEEGVNWITQSARNGYHRAQYELGALYFLGKYVDNNIDEAMKWFKMSSTYRLDTTHQKNLKKILDLYFDLQHEILKHSKL